PYAPWIHLACYGWLFLKEIHLHLASTLFRHRICIEKARPKIILFCEMGAVINRSSLFTYFTIIEKSLTRKNFVASFEWSKGSILGEEDASASPKV
ncbi:hypothetical protein, partial [Bacillus licheniformis]|uniref:hypothetical protein n=1 Tax=Bacillus licheniformis TaxID=1402 RepID=UPI00195E04E2